MIILDSSVLIPLITRNHEHRSLALEKWSDIASAFGISTLSITESSIHRIRNQGYESEIAFRDIEDFVEHFETVSVGLAKRAAEICAHSGLKATDGIIVATAEFNDLELWTCDAKMADAYSKATNLLADNSKRENALENTTSPS